MGEIGKITLEEFLNAIRLVKTDKATSNDCTTDFVVRELLKPTTDEEALIQSNFRENFLGIVNECFVTKTIP